MREKKRLEKKEWNGMMRPGADDSSKKREHLSEGFCANDGEGCVKSGWVLGRVLSRKSKIITYNIM